MSIPVKGTLVGVPKLLEILDKYDVTATFFSGGTRQYGAPFMATHQT
ncbi:hypothetical protein P4S72_19690 [Vibrio sp. PP-XX7]